MEEKMVLIKRGAEAEVYETKDNVIIKRRIPKQYRIPELDKALNIKRTKKEAKIIKKINRLGINSPSFIKATQNDVFMEKITDCFSVNEVFNSLEIAKNLSENGEENLFKNICEKIGNIIFHLHSNDIIHGDLTPLNFLIKKYNPIEIYVIDFGLSFNSNKLEDKAVDLFLFEKILKSSYPDYFADSLYQGYYKNFESNPSSLLGEKKLNSVETFAGQEKLTLFKEKIEQVRMRGRKRSDV